MANSRTPKPRIWFACLLLLAGCSHDYQLMRAEEHFNGYDAAIRWNLLKRALTYLKNPPKYVDWAYLKELKVTGYQREFQDLLPSGKVAMRTVEIRYIPPDSVMETKLIDEQRWRYDEEQERWLLETGLPHFKGMQFSKPVPVTHGMSGEQPLSGGQPVQGNQGEIAGQGQGREIR